MSIVPRVRVAVEADLEAIARIEAESMPQAWSERDLAPWLDADRGLLLVAETEAGLVAHAAFLLLPGEAELLRLAVVPARRRLGVATQLVESGLARLAAGGRRVCFLEVRHDNLAAVALYRALDFRPSGRREGYYGDGADALLFRREAASELG